MYNCGMEINMGSKRHEPEVVYKLLKGRSTRSDWDEKLAHAERAISLRRVAKKARKNKPITFAKPSLWLMSGKRDER